MQLDQCLYGDKDETTSWSGVENIPNTINPNEDLLKRVLVNANSVADLGPCFGKTMEEMLKINSELKIDGYDFNETAVNFLREKFKDNKDVSAYQTDLLATKLNGNYDVITATSLVSCFRENNMKKLFEMIDPHLNIGGKLMITDFPYLPENEKKQEHYKRGLEADLPLGTFRVPKKDNLEVTHLNPRAVEIFLKRHNYEVQVCEVIEQVKNEKEMHPVLYIIAEKKSE